MFTESPEAVLTHGNHSSEVCVGILMDFLVRDHPEVEWFRTPQGAIVTTGMALPGNRVGIPSEAITSVFDLRGDSPRAFTDAEIDDLIRPRP